MWFIPALVGAVIYAALHEWIEWALRKAEKRKNCHHVFLTKDETQWGGFRTRHCHKCGHQEPVREDKDRWD